MRGMSLSLLGLFTVLLLPGCINVHRWKELVPPNAVEISREQAQEKLRMCSEGEYLGLAKGDFPESMTCSPRPQGGVACTRVDFYQFKQNAHHVRNLQYITLYFDPADSVVGCSVREVELGMYLW